jgi:hypothetical protein
MGRGRKPDHERRQRAADPRAQGLSWEEIGRELGVSKQCAYRNALVVIKFVFPQNATYS